MHKRWNIRRLTIWVVLTMQIVLVIMYFATQNENSTPTIPPNLKVPIKFISTSVNETKPKQTYHKENDTIVLQSKLVGNYFEDFNTSLCYKMGTDLKRMKRSKDTNWKCLCLSGWHGIDCGQPEVIWRALLTSKKRQSISGPRKVQRRLIYFLSVDIISADFTEIVLHELSEVTDLIVLYDYNPKLSVQSKLKNGFLKDFYKKILYINGADQNKAWLKTKRLIRNLKEDDIFLISNPFEIPNVRVLQFLKLYNEWPQPLTFRLKWSVYGFFWKHPLKTTLTTGACTIKYLEELNNNLDTLKNKLHSIFIVGDLNHFGGWFCQFCSEPSLIITSLQLNLIRSKSILEKLEGKNVNVAFVEDLIENGIYLDSKTELERAHRSNENYYAPNVVNNNSWKYDWLLINLYSKIDYY